VVVEGLGVAVVVAPRVTPTQTLTSAHRPKQSTRMLGFHLNRSAREICVELSTELQLKFRATKKNLLQLETISGCVGWGVAIPLPVAVVEVTVLDALVTIGEAELVEGLVLAVVLGLGEDVGGSSAIVPMTQ
jgi:hypothetical protein